MDVSLQQTCKSIATTHNRAVHQESSLAHVLGFKNATYQENRIYRGREGRPAQAACSESRALTEGPLQVV